MNDLNNNIDNILKYWRQSLIDADKFGFNKSRIYERLDGDSTSVVKKSVVQRLFNEYRKYRKRLKPSDAQSEKDGVDSFSEVPVLYAAPFIGRHINHRGDEEIAIPLCFQAYVSEEGDIRIHAGSIPFFNPDYIEPYAQEGFSFGVDRKQIEKAISAIGLIPENTTPENLNVYVEKLLRHALGGAYETLGFSDPYEEISERYVKLDVDQRGLNQPLIEVYEDILEKAQKPILVKSVFTTSNNKVLSPVVEDEKNHLGHISGQFPLNEGQRRILYANDRLDDGNILAVTGPPGTGKTTLIGNVIASEWVKAALRQGEPPVIFVTSTNNQAVQNALDSFPTVDDLPSKHPLRHNINLFNRWLKEAPSLGTLFPSSMVLKKDDIKRFQCVSRELGKKKWSGWFCDLESLNQLDQRKAYYVDCAEKSFPQKDGLNDVASVVDFLHVKIRKYKTYLDDALKLKQEITSFIDHYQVDDISRFIDDKIRMLALEEKDLAGDLKKFVDLYQHRVKARKNYNRLCQRALQLFEPKNIFEALGSLFFESFKQRRSLRVIGFLSDLDRLPNDWSFDTILSEAVIKKHFRYYINRVEKIARDTRKKKEDVQILQAKVKRERDDWSKVKVNYDDLIERWTDLIEEIYMYDKGYCADRLPALVKDPKLFSEELDVYCRLPLFTLVSRYWEGRWLLDLDAMRDNNSDRLYGSSQDDIEGFFRRISKITPCLGSTLHRLPRLLQYFNSEDQRNSNLYDFIDLLIMDEAGQVATEIGMVGLAFAKKALVIGDTDQIEPVRKFGDHQDTRLMKQFHFVERYEAIKNRGFSVSDGNMMHMAKTRTTFTLDETTAGMFLSDHWRCVPEIIEYCNELVYQGRLKPRKLSIENPPFPPMGFAHLSGMSIKQGGSRCNPIEAGGIAQWIVQNAEAIKAAYGKNDQSLKDIIGIITPFAAQSAEIVKALRVVGIKEKIQVGTVHSFQGGEKDIIIFSPVYGGDDGVSSYFFDQGTNMLNVAVSRAKNSFLAFGDMRVFSCQSVHRPSGLLGQYLFADPNNEITDVKMPSRVFASTIKAKCERIRTLDDHRSVLREALIRSQKRLVITSAFLSINAIEEDDVIPLLKQAEERGVEYLILYDIAFNKDKVVAQKALTAFENSKVSIHGVRGIHYKTLAYDDTFYMDGSFNWLSAQRDTQSLYHHQEGSILVRGEEAKEWIDQTWLEARKFVKATQS
jgi:DNA polymerase III delta prime subunit